MIGNTSFSLLSSSSPPFSNSFFEPDADMKSAVLMLAAIFSPSWNKKFVVNPRDICSLTCAAASIPSLICKLLRFLADPSPAAFFLLGWSFYLFSNIPPSELSLPVVV